MLNQDENQSLGKGRILASATQIISAHLGNNPVALPDVPGFIKTVFATLSEMDQVEAAGERQRGIADHGVPTGAPQKPAVAINSSVHDDYIVCLEDGKKLRMLKRYLMAQFQMTPEQYRAKWGLPDSYPMVAPAVSQQRRHAAIASGLGASTSRKKRRKKQGY